ncbi:unnamed protein product [Rotaria sp. Silwood1]|nr:unnamed protein product [Rotaria sp. Silwood1]CAF1642605.1 unnamed protein product [Rotaria sp. Silwood1]
MSTQSTQIGAATTESITMVTNSEGDLNQILTDELVILSQSSIQLNMTNMIPSQVPNVPNPTTIHQNLTEDEFRARRRKARRRQRQRRAERRRQARASQHQQRNQQREEGRSERRRRERYQRWQQRLAEREQQEYDYSPRYEYRSRWERRREYDLWSMDSSDYFMDDTYIEPLLEQYDLETGDPTYYRDQENISVLEGMAALEQLMQMQDEIEQSQQIRTVADWDQEKLNEMNERKNWTQKQLNDFERTPTTKQDHLVEDEIEQLRQSDAAQKIQEEKRMQIDLNDQ